MPLHVGKESDSLNALSEVPLFSLVSDKLDGSADAVESD